MSSRSSDSGIRSVSDIFEESFQLQEAEWVGWKGKHLDDEDNPVQVMTAATSEPFGLVYKHWGGMKM